ncbi:MAG TPA: isoprenylcysteine carboxylmethyltransferase family protein, partial [Thermoanaerobaculia bacterium]|nr:isoprenylcysteine carboxylmethyltransferase family protein [Thermoanaerobaculia bacterium]
GPYRYVRNPMIAGVILIIIAESLLFRSLSLAEWAAAFFVINAIYFPLIEEPQLESRFGEEYRRYKRHVRRFVPRIQPWKDMAQ